MSRNTLAKILMAPALISFVVGVCLIASDYPAIIALAFVTLLGAAGVALHD